MAICGVRDIIKLENDENSYKLHTRSEMIDPSKENERMRGVIKDLKRTVRKLNLTSLSAPAIGENIRIFCINFNGDVKTFINPIISHVKGLQLSRENCTSIPGKEFIRPRNTEIEVMYQTPLGTIENRQLIGLAAYKFQHEMDHLEGMLINDVGIEVPEGYDNYTDEQKQELITEYMDELDMMTKELNKEIEETPNLKELKDGINYMSGVKKGEIKVATDEELDEMAKKSTDSK